MLLLQPLSQPLVFEDEPRNYRVLPRQAPKLFLLSLGDTLLAHQAALLRSLDRLHRYWLACLVCVVVLFGLNLRWRRNRWRSRG
jgi:hypothetical protein